MFLVTNENMGLCLYIRIIYMNSYLISYFEVVTLEVKPISKTKYFLHIFEFHLSHLHSIYVKTWLCTFMHLKS